jgi:hypothetical protein
MGMFAGLLVGLYLLLTLAVAAVAVPIGLVQVGLALRSRRTRRSSPRHMRGTRPQPGTPHPSASPPRISR